MKQRKVTKSMLRDQIGSPGPRPFLYCPKCQSRYSANAGDYFMAPDSHVFKCCGRNNWLVTEYSVLRQA